MEAGSEDVTFPPLPPDNFSLAEAISNQPTDTFDGCASGLNAPGQSPARLAQSGKGLCGKRLWEMGGDLVEVFRGVSSLCSQSTAKGGRPGNLGPKCTFPLPTRRNQIAHVLKAEESWVVEWVFAACLGLNSRLPSRITAGWGTRLGAADGVRGAHPHPPVYRSRRDSARGN